MNDFPSSSRFLCCQTVSKNVRLVYFLSSSSTYLNTQWFCITRKIRRVQDADISFLMKYCWRIHFIAFRRMVSPFAYDWEIFWSTFVAWKYIFSCTGVYQVSLVRCMKVLCSICGDRVKVFELIYPSWVSVLKGENISFLVRKGIERWYNYELRLDKFRVVLKWNY